MVILEGTILPVVAVAPEILCRLVTAPPNGPDPKDLAKLFGYFPQAAKDLRDCGARVLDPVDVRITGADADECRAAADIVDEAHQLLWEAAERCQAGGILGDHATVIADMLAHRLRPAVEQAVVTIQRVFLIEILQRQYDLNMRSAAAIRQLAQVSQMIFILGVNASIEAARSGEAAGGLAFIAEDIRRLGNNTRAIADDLRATFDTAPETL